MTEGFLGRRVDLRCVLGLSRRRRTRDQQCYGQPPSHGDQTNHACLEARNREPLNIPLTKDNWPHPPWTENNEEMWLLQQRPSLSIFVFLQILDILTTLIGLSLGAGEASAFVATLMHLGPIQGLLISKILAVILVLIALRRRQPRIVVLANFWFAGLVTWNLALIFTQAWRIVQA